MKKSINCPSCQTLFNHKANSPLVLSCSHDLCKKCCFQQYKSLNKITCPYQGCQIETLKEFVELEVDIQILDGENVKDQLTIEIQSELLSLADNLNEIQRLHDKTLQMKQVLIGKNQEFTHFIQKASEEQIVQIIRKRNSYQEEFQNQTSKRVQELDKKVQKLSEIKNLIETGNLITTYQLPALLQIKKNLLKIQKWKHEEHTEEDIQILDKIRLQDYFKKDLFEFDVQNFHKDMTILNDKKILKQLLFTIVGTTQMIVYDVKEKSSKGIQIQTSLFGNYHRAIQIDNDILIVTGGYIQGEGFKNRFSIIKLDQIKEFQMTISRTGHSIAYYPKKNLVFLISGFNGTFLTNCEAFNLESYQNINISPIPEASYYGGAAILYDQLYNFGGTSGVQNYLN